jgi:hypothetical protein
MARGERKERQKGQGKKGWKLDWNIPFLSLLPLSWRPNLGLFGPNAASHLREKGFENCPMLKSPIE